MSRICGIARAGMMEVQGHAAIQRLIQPQLHSSDFSTETCCLDGVAFGRVLFRNYNFSTHLCGRGRNQDGCVFSGYLRDLPALRRRVEQESQGALRPDSPAEAIAYLLRKHGPSLLSNLSGSYSFALWFAESQQLLLGSDRYGMNPLYYSQRGPQLIFASEIKAIVNLEPDSEVNLPAFQEIVALGHPLDDGTMYPSIHRLPPASILTFHNGRLEIERYWWYDQLPAPQRITVPEFLETAQQLLNRSISALLEQIQNPVCMLSAGYDSRRILLELATHSKPISAYTAPIVHDDGRFEYDVLIAQALCERFGVSHHASELPAPSEAGKFARYTSRFLDFGTDFHAWVLPLMPEVPSACGVNFDGLGGDVLYESNFIYEAEAAHSDDPGWLSQAVLTRFPDLWPAHFRLAVNAPPLAERIERLLRALPAIDHRYTLFYFTNWTRRMTALLPFGLLSLKLDSVFPFLDYDLVDFLFSLPPLIKRNTEVSKAMLHMRDPKLAESIPTSHYPGIHTNPDALCRPFCRPIPPGYIRASRAAVYRSAASDVLDCKGVLGQLSFHAQAAVLGIRLTQSMKSVPASIINRSWPLTFVGEYALQRRTVGNPAWSAAHLDQARQYVFSKRPACVS